MPNGATPSDPRWPRLLSLAVHEFRTPVTVVAGYIRMLLKDRAGALTEQQRKLLEEAEKSTGRLSALIAEMSDLANLEAGSATFNRSRVDIGALVGEVVGALPPLVDREVTVTFTNDAPGASVDGDPVRLKTALGALLVALRRELVSSTELRVRLQRATSNGHRELRMSIGDGDRAATEDARADQPGTFDEWRGGCGLSLAVARRILNAHDGQVWAPPENARAGAVVTLPEA